MRELIIILLLTSFGYGQSAHVQNPLLSDRFLVTVGIYWPSDDYAVGVNGSSQKNNSFDFDENFNVKNNHITPVIGFHWRFTKKWHLNTEYFQLGYKRRATLENDIQWGDYTFKAGTSAEAGISLNMYRIALGRTIYQNDRFLMIGGLGLHAMNIKAFIEGNAYINDEQFSSERVSVKGVAPLPNITLTSLYVFSKKISGSFRIDWFALNIDQFSGGLWDINPILYFQAFEHLGFSMGYNFFDFNFEFDDQNWKGTFETIYHGPSIGITSNF
ncbi:hypothetical protein [Namhaeicola litoreus]|uniref:Outer membrane protein beta-barrel domain-containing protein n=1 Tax=Namhaeicola litoreus TaxID=1052145 RepID=A0ABW3Y4R9_9FLAO